MIELTIFLSATAISLLVARLLYILYKAIRRKWLVRKTWRIYNKHKALLANPPDYLRYQSNYLA